MDLAIKLVKLKTNAKEEAKKDSKVYKSQSLLTPSEKAKDSILLLPTRKNGYIYIYIYI